MKNYIDQTIGFTFLLLLMLLGLSLAPAGLQLASVELRKMDLLADVRKNNPDTIGINNLPSPTVYPDTQAVSVDSLQTDTLAVQNPLPPKDSSYFGKRFEDYTFDQSGLHSFFAAIDSIKLGKKVRLAWYGDSFVEGDILIGDLRDSLQTLWGGRGVGFVPITSEVAQFKRTLKHNFSHWNTYSVIKKNEARPLLGLNGYAYQPREEAKVEYQGATYFKNTRSWTDIRLFYKTSTENNFNYRLGSDSGQTGLLLPKDNRLNLWSQELNYPGVSNISFSFSGQNDLVLYGASLESGPGIYIDNFSIRGNSGGPLKQLRPDFIQEFDAIQKYDLVVLQVGLNAVTNGYENIRWYQAELERTFSHLRECFPRKPILIISVADRGGKIDGELATMRGVPAIVNMQRELARKHGFVFYDLYHGMGGAGTMIRYSMHHPRLANTDYTHLTHDGGRVVGYLFLNQLLNEQLRLKQKKQLQ